MLSVFWSPPNVVPDSTLSMLSLFVAFVVVLEMCVLKVSVLSSVIPKNLASFENLIGLLIIRIGVGCDVVFELKRTH